MRGDSRKFAPRLGTLASTALVALAHPPVEWSALIVLSLVPWFFALERCRTLAQAVAQGMWLNFLLGFTSVFWVASTVQRYLGVSLVAGIAALALHALVHQLQLAVFAGVHWRAARAAAPRSFAAVVAAALLYTGIDWATPKVFHDTLGLMLHADPALRQLAAIGGAPLLTFVVLFANLALFALARAVFDAARTSGLQLRPLIARVLWLALPLLAFYAFGAWEYARVGRSIEAAARIVRAGFVQGSLPDGLKRRWSRGDPDAARESLETYLRATRELVERGDAPDFVVWPETSYPGVFRKPESDAQLTLNVEFDRSIAARGLPLVFGAYDREERSDRRVLRNAVYFVAPARGQAGHELSPMQVYQKSILFPFGEYFPLLEEATVRRWLPHSAHFSRGPGPRKVALPLAAGGPIQLGPSICYEDVFADYTAELAKLGVELLLNVSNDTWLGDTGARLHLISATIRSVETRLPQLRVVDSGYSALILPNGDLRHTTRFGEPEAKTIPVPIVEATPTLRMRWGDWFGPTSLVLGLLALRRGKRSAE